MVTPLGPYDPNIDDAASDTARAKAERKWTAKLDLQRLIRTAERCGRNLIIAAVEETWILSLKSSSTFYNKVSIRDLIDHLTTSTVGLEATDIVSLFIDMVGLWREDPRVPEFINKMEEAQKKAARANLPISDEWLAAIATKSLIAEGSFPKVRNEWDSRAAAAKLQWTDWKKWAREAQIGVEREQRATGDRGDVFGSAAAACAIHGITPTPPTTPFAGAASSLSISQQMEQGLDNLALAVTNEKTVLDTLVATNKLLTDQTATKLAKIEHLLACAATSSPPPPAANAPASSDRIIAQLRAAIKHKWAPGNFCSTHGHGVLSRPHQCHLQVQKGWVRQHRNTCQPGRSRCQQKQRLGRLFDPRGDGVGPRIVLVV